MKTLVLAALLAVPALGSAHGTGEHRAPPGTAAQAEQTPFGRAGDPAKARRTIEIGMTDAMRYEPAEIRVKQGETVKIVASNKGRVLHEIVIGTMDELKEHAALMRKFPEMEHDEPNMAHVKPGAREALVWQFNKPGEFHFACLVPGHFEAGMVGKIVVASAALAQGAGHEPNRAATGAAAADAALTRGEVKKIDKAGGKITLKHGRIENLDMPGMTMVFRAKDPSALDQVQVGDNVIFRAERVDGALMVTQLRKAS